MRSHYIWIIAFLMEFLRHSCAFTSRYSFSCLAPTKTIIPTTPKLSARLLDSVRLSARAKSSISQERQRPFHLVIVESPSKCKTIEAVLQKYVQQQQLQHDFQVSSCMGHVRNLPIKGHGIPDPKYPYTIAGIDLAAFTPYYEIIPQKKEIIRTLQSRASKAEKVWLATDPDREGEAMAWHLTQVLNLQPEQYGRISFTEITETGILQAIQQPKELNTHLVEAQETRRVLDRLAGFTVTPILWKKISPGLSAGRVQSVGLHLIVARERERLGFEPTTYWDLKATFLNNLEAELQAVNGTVIADSASDFTTQGSRLVPKSAHKLHLQEDDAQQLLHQLEDAEWHVIKVKSSKRTDSPPPPYKTSTLQQDAVRRLGISVKDAMRAAQQLYEKGLITYMRTDSTQLSETAQEALSRAIPKLYGVAAVSIEQYAHRRKESKFAQESHEAIRPVIKDGGFVSPDEINLSDKRLVSIYRLIYARTLASRMPPLISNVTQILIEGVKDDTTVHCRASGSVTIDPGYTRAYEREGTAVSELPPLKEGELLNIRDLVARPHVTSPPPRYTEATLVKTLESLGVGRPSTYEGVMRTLRERAYAGSPAKKGRFGKIQQVSGAPNRTQRAAGGKEFTNDDPRGPLVPSLSAFAVCSLLEKYCPAYVEPSFTATMENRLDLIASGERPSEQERISYLEEFYGGADGLATKVKYIEDEVDVDEARRVVIPSIERDTNSAFGIFVGPYGPYVQKVNDSDPSDKKISTATLPEDMAFNLSSISAQSLSTVFSNVLSNQEKGGTLSNQGKGGTLLGNHPDDGRPITLKTGPYGAYLQWGESGERGTTTHSFPQGKFVSVHGENVDKSADEGKMCGITLEEAIGYVQLPRTVTTLEGMPITTALGPYGPYLKYKNKYVSLDEKDGDPISIDADTAKQVITEQVINGKPRKSRDTVSELGEKDGSMVCVKTGRYGPYINWGKINARLPAEIDLHAISLDEAWALVKDAEKSTKIGQSSPSTKTTKEPSLPSPPKRPKSAYLFFCDDKRSEVAESAGSLGEVSKQMAALWANATQEDRQLYEDLAATAKEVYLKEKEEWTMACQDVLSKSSTEPPTKPKTDSIPTKPKRPKSAYLYFCDEMRPTLATKSQPLGAVAKELAKLWAKTEDRSKYEKLAEEDKARYEKEKAEFSDVNGKSISGVLVSNKNKANAAPSTSSPRAPSAYMLFCRQYRSTIINDDGEKLPLVETTKRLAALWKDCDEETRSKFQKMADEEKNALRTATQEKLNT